MKRISTLMTRTKVDELQQTFEKQAVKETIPVRILGPRASGKTSFLYKAYFKYNSDQPHTEFDVIPTPNHNVEVVPFSSYSFELWDFAEISHCLNHIHDNTRVIIYMLDSSQYHKQTVAKKSRENMIWLLEHFQKQLENAIIITVANKQDISNEMDVQDIAHCWVNDKPLMDLLKGHDWRIFPCNSVTAEGLDTIFEYLTTKLNRKSTSIDSLHSVQQQNLITPWESLSNPYHLNDQEFKHWFYSNKQFLFFDHWCLIRIIYLTMASSSYHENHIKRKQRQLLLHQQLQQMNSIRYSETQTLFWTQMVSFALLKSPLLEGEKNDFESFLIRCQLKEDCWKLYYTQKLFYSERATREFLPPDKKSLPNAFKSSSLALRGSQLRINYEVL